MCQSIGTLIKAWGLFLKTLSFASAILLLRFEVGHRHPRFGELIFNLVGQLCLLSEPVFRVLCLCVINLSVCVCS